MERREQFRGCLLGGAVGDALGAPVEFMSREAILARFGPGGVKDFEPVCGHRGAITDDTQMTLFTVEGLIRAGIRMSERGVCNPVETMRYAYERWLATQGETPPNASCFVGDAKGWLLGVSGLHSRRAPGNTCLGALRVWEEPRPLEARNNSKGCGGVMRVAPVGLVSDQPYELGCATAAITHGHALGWQSSGAMALLISELLKGASLEAAVRRTLAQLAPDAGELRVLLERAVDFAGSDRPAPECITDLGEGWVAEEALAIGLFAALRASDLEEAIVIAVNHSGDSDSTGSIAGQIMGTLCGVSAIPERYLAQLELRAVIERIADDLYDWSVGKHLVQDEQGRQSVSREWWERYPGC